MLRLLGSNFQHARRQRFTCHLTLITRKPKLLVQSGSIVPSMPATDSSNRSLFTSSSVMDALPSNTCKWAGTLDDVFKRLKNTLVVQKRVVELPTIPPIPSKKRTFHLRHEELETHVRPLLSCHWHVGYVGDRVADDRQVVSLNKLFGFKNFRSSVEFFNELVSIQDEEDHHARVTIDYSKVYVSIHTHCAYPGTSDADMATKPIKVPGLTLRDVRFAVRVEELHETFLDDGRAITKVPVDSASLQAWSMEQLQSRYAA